MKSVVIELAVEPRIRQAPWQRNGRGRHLNPVVWSLVAVFAALLISVTLTRSSLMLDAPYVVHFLFPFLAILGIALVTYLLVDRAVSTRFRERKVDEAVRTLEALQLSFADTDKKLAELKPNKVAGGS